MKVSTGQNWQFPNLRKEWGTFGQKDAGFFIERLPTENAEATPVAVVMIRDLL